MLEHFFCLIVIISSLLSGSNAQFGNIQYYRRSDEYPLPERQGEGILHHREEHTLNRGHKHDHRTSGRDDDAINGQQPVIVTPWVEHSRNDAIPFNMVPDSRRNVRRGEREESGRNDYTSSSRRGDNMDGHERYDVNMSTIYDIFFKNSTKRASDAQDANPMVFPSDQASNCTNKSVSNTSSSCDFGLCEDMDDYPGDKIKKFISRSRILRQYFEQHQVPGVSFNNRFGEDGDPLCPTRTHTVFPRSAPNTQNVKKIIVNVDEYKQGVIYETCVREGGQCSQASEFPNGFTTSCKQKYAVRRLMAVSGDMEEPVFDDFELPSCCVCMIKKA